MTVTSISHALDLNAPRFEVSADEATRGWGDVLARAAAQTSGSDTTTVPAARARASRRWLSPRRLAIAVVILLAAIFVAIAIAGSFSGFTNWLTGQPGRPASTAQQRAFDRATRSWAGFPHATSLRLLTKTTVGGATYTLYGFRAAGALCLRLIVAGNVSVHQLACTPLSLLQTTNEPAVVVGVDEGVGQIPFSANHPTVAGLSNMPQAYVTYGIVADGIRSVEIANYNGSPVNAFLGGDAFLTVDQAPSVSEHVTRVWAIGDGKRASIPFTLPNTLPFLGRTPPTAPVFAAQGPATVQREVHGGTIGWLTRRVPVGAPVAKNIHHLWLDEGTVVFEREIAPDPGAPERLVVSLVSVPSAGRQICVNVVGGRYGGGSDCWPVDQSFSVGNNAFGSYNGVQTGIQVSGYAPFDWVATQAAPVIPGSTLGNQYLTIAGLASDTVAALRLYVGNGQTEPVPLHDNGYLAEAPVVDYPARLVAYDIHGNVIGIVTFTGPTTPLPRRAHAYRPVPNARWRLSFSRSAGYVFEAPATNGGTCDVIAIHDGGGSSGCGRQLPPTELFAAESYAGQRGQPRTFTITIQTGTAITHVTVRYRNGHSETVQTPHGAALVTVPASDRITVTNSTFPGLAELNNLAQVTALNAHDQTVALTASGTITALSQTTITVTDNPIGGAKPINTNCALTAASPRTFFNGTPYKTSDPVNINCAGGRLTMINPGRALP